MPTDTIRRGRAVKTSRLRIALLLMGLPHLLLAQAVGPPQSEPQAPAEPRAEEQSQKPAVAESEAFQWGPALRQSALFLGVQHSSRVTQKKMRRELGGPFFSDYFESVSNIRTWSDQDGILTNYVGHPMMGATAGYFQIHNDPRGRRLRFDPASGDYWRSRLKALAWSAAYSTQFEIGPVSEAAIGTVGKNAPTMAWVDLVMTPLGGFGLIVLEDYLDSRFIRGLEQGGGFKARFFRVVLNPNRAVANLFRLKPPSYRDDRPLP